MSSALIRSSLQEASRCLAIVLADEALQATLSSLTSRLVDTFNAGGKVLAGGNGGSMADAMHFAEEWTGRFKKDRKPFPALAMSDPTHWTCVGNDYGFEYGFSRMVEAFAKPGDVVLLLSTSGNSKNLLLAAESARAAGAHVVGFLGRGGGSLAPLCDTVFMAPGETSDRIQEIHMMCLHILIEATEVELGVA
ncbi:MAG: SIS domain-containing protein [Fimbriimonas sp.]|nr:SIS domain-containing protein [Fimbriimonas sp.]